MKPKSFLKRKQKDSTYHKLKKGIRGKKKKRRVGEREQLSFGNFN